MSVRLKKNKLNFYFLILFISKSMLFSAENSLSVNLIQNNSKNNFWWIEKNNYGINPYNNYLYTTFNRNHKKVSLKINLLLNSSESQWGESFLNFNVFNHSHLKIGTYYRDFSTYLNDELSSGHMLISNNAEPIPKIGFISRNKVNNRNDISFLYGISHGFFQKNKNYLKAPFLHEKFVYLELNKNDTEFGIGFIHEAMWAGETSGNGESTGSTFKDFLKVIIAEDGPKNLGDKHANALGNHLGIWDFYMIKSFNNKKIKIYYQHFFEDTSGLRFANRFDGLWGIEFIHPNKLDLLIEYLQTSNQDLSSDYLRDGYYNHSTYIEGWSYKNQVIGNPFINNEAIVPLDVIHLGIDAQIHQKMKLKLKLSRKINEFDKIKYLLEIGNYKCKKGIFNHINFFIANNHSDKHILGLKLTYYLK